MATYTKISKKEIQKIAAAYSLGLKEFHPMEGGISNSNYLLNTDRGYSC